MMKGCTSLNALCLCMCLCFDRTFLFSEVQALNDFKARIAKYEEVYEPLDDRNRHYIKLIDM